MSIEYIMDDPREGRRLADKVDAESWVNTYIAPAIGESKEVLDVGCGPGVLARAIGDRYADATVVGVDASEERVAEGRGAPSKHSNVSLQVGSANELPVESNRFDLVYSRFLLEYLPEKQEAVREMARVCKPGGTVVLQDLDGQCLWHYPPDEILERDLEFVESALAKTGFDAFVGRKLYALARGAGLNNSSVRADSYHLFAGKIDEKNRSLWELKLDIAKPVVAQALGGEEQAARFIDRFLEYLSREDTLTYSIMFTAYCQKECCSTESLKRRV